MSLCFFTLKLSFVSAADALSAIIGYLTDALHRRIPVRSRWDFGEINRFQLTVFDALGVERASIELQDPVAPLPAALPTGVYFFRLSSAGLYGTGKFILQ